MASGSLEPKDRVFLDGLCQRTQPNEEDNSNDDGDYDEPGSSQFLAAFLRYIYSGNYPTDRGVGKLVTGFINRLQELGVHTPLRARNVIRESTTFTPDDLVHSVSVQLAVELKRFYCDGAVKLHKQLKESRKEGGKEADGGGLDIHNKLTAVENFMIFNKMSGNKWKIAPVSTTADHFVLFSESQIVSLCWKRELLKPRILQIVRTTFPTCTTKVDVRTSWLPDKEPGFLLRRLIADVDPVGLTVRRRGKLGYRGAIHNKSVQDIKDHLTNIRKPNFDPREYNNKGYILAGSICTNGFQLYLSAFKMREFTVSSLSKV
ncbi:hypothetical protein BGZ58_007965 [Dissophora ornata]|nr:hypothetical protein BGZ58_007965 [Dissophora ornata]